MTTILQLLANLFHPTTIRPDCIDWDSPLTQGPIHPKS